MSEHATDAEVLAAFDQAYYRQIPIITGDDRARAVMAGLTATLPLLLVHPSWFSPGVPCEWIGCDDPTTRVFDARDAGLFPYCEKHFEDACIQHVKEMNGAMQ